MFPFPTEGRNEADCDYPVVWESRMAGTPHVIEGLKFIKMPGSGETEYIE